jgi:hypothetical protein
VKKGDASDGEQTHTVTAETLRRSRLYSEELGISLKGTRDAELFKWFLASVLFGARISEGIAQNTYRSFEKHGLLEPDQILKAGWDFLVNPVMRDGGYVRYDEKTSREILRNCDMLVKDYGGRLNRLHRTATDSGDLERRLDDFYGVGPVTVNIFLRELRPFWSKADPEPLPAVVTLAAHHGIDLSRFRRKSLDFIRVEAGLVRMRKLVKQMPAFSGRPSVSR